MRSFVALLALLLAGCASMFESPREAIVEVLEELPQSEGEKYSGYTYIPLDPLAVVFQGCQNDGAACKILDSERRKNTQASSDVGARQLARF